jgi:hypothetical protein
MKKYLIFLLLITACQPSEKNQESFETLEVFKMPATELEFESVRFVPLSSGNDHLVGSTLLTRLYDGEIFILDRGSNKNIFRFNGSGEFLNAIGNSGRGAEEFTGALDFANHGDTVSVLTNLGRVVSYLKDGTFVKSISVNLGAISFEWIPSGYIIYTGTNPEYSYRFYTTDYNGRVQDSLLKDETKWEFPVIEENFSIHHSDVFIHESFFNSLYAYRSGKLEQTYILDMSQYNIPPGYYSKSMMEVFPMMQKQGFGSIFNYFENSRFPVFVLSLQKEGDDPEVFQFVYDKKRKKLFRHSFTGNDTDDEVFRNLIGLTDRNEMIYLVFPIQVIDNLDVLKDYETGSESVIEEVNEMDNPIIAFCKIK